MKEDVDEDVPEEVNNVFLAIEPPTKRVGKASKGAEVAFKK